MDRGEPSLKPEWLVRGPGTVAATSLRPGTSPRADDQGEATSSRNRPSGRDRDRERRSQPSSSRRGSSSSGSRRQDRDGTGKSSGYGSFGRSNRDRGCEKGSDIRDSESRLGPPDDPMLDAFKPFSSCRPERDRADKFNHTRLKVDTWNRTVGVSLKNGSLSRKDAGSISFEREFPYLGSEDKNMKQEVGRVPSPGISTPIQSIPLITASDGWNSVLAEVPIVTEPSHNIVSSPLSLGGSSKQMEVPSCGTALSMAETVMQAPLKISTAPQLLIDAQKIEERTMRQCILRPLTPSSNKFSVSSSSDKVKNKGARVGDSNGPIKVAPQLSVQPSSSSVRAPVKTELVKPSQSGNLQVLSREQNGIANSVKDCTSNPVSPVLGRSSSVEPLKRPIVNQKPNGVTNVLPLHLRQGPCGERKASAKDKHKFFELLRSKSLNSSATAIESSSSLIDEQQQQNSSLDLSMFNSRNKCTENGSSSCEEANSCEGSQQHLSDNEEINLHPEAHDLFDEGTPLILADNRDAGSLELADRGVTVSMKLQPGKAEASLPIIPADINEVSINSDSGDDEANVSFESIEGEEEPYPAQEKPCPEEMAFLISLGWKEDEIVPPLKQEEIADCLRHNVRLQQKLEECKG